MQALLALERDAGLRRRRAMQAALGLGAIGLFALGYLGAASQQGDDPDVCTGANDKIANTWDEQRRQNLKQLFVNSGQSYAADTYRSVQATLDRISADWIEMFTETCQATRVRGEQSEQMLDRRMRCLELRLTEMNSVIGLLQTGETEVIERAVKTVENLTPISRCSLAEASLDELPAAEIADEVARLEEQQAKASVLLQAARSEEASAIVDESLARAHELGYPPLLASLYRIKAEIAVEKVAPDQIREAALQGLEYAIVGKSDRLAAELMTVRVRAAALAADAHAGPELLALSEAWVQRIPHDPLLAYQVQSDAGLLSFHLGDYDGARKRFERALKIAREELPHARHRLANVLNNLGGIAGSQRQIRTLARIHERGSRDPARGAGETPPRTLVILENIATSNHHTGDTELAIQQLQEVIGVRKEVLGEGHPSLARAYNNLATMMFDQRHPDEALGYARKALDMRVAQLGEHHPGTALFRVTLAVALLDLEQYEQARPQLDQAVADSTLETGPHPNLQAALIARQRLFRLLEMFEQATADLDQLERLEQQLEIGERLRGEIQGERARLLAARGEGPDAVRPLIAQALRRLEDPNARRELRDLEDWLREHPQYRPAPGLDP